MTTTRQQEVTAAQDQVLYTLILIAAAIAAVLSTRTFHTSTAALPYPLLPRRLLVAVRPPRIAAMQSTATRLQALVVQQTLLAVALWQTGSMHQQVLQVVACLSLQTATSLLSPARRCHCPCGSICSKQGELSSSVCGSVSLR